VESPSVATKLTTVDDDPKEKLKKIAKRERWSRHHSLLWKVMKNQEKGKANDLQIRDEEFGSRFRVEKVLTPNRACPKTVPLMK